MIVARFETRHVVLLFVTFFCIVFGKRYPRGSNDSVVMIDGHYANRTVPKNALNSTEEKDRNLTRNFENSESVVVVDSGLMFNGTRDSLKNYPNVNQFRLRRTIAKNDNLKKIKTGNKKSDKKKKLPGRAASSHQDHSNRNHTQKDANKKTTNSKIQREKVKGAVSKNKNVTAFGHHHHHHHHNRHLEEIHHSHPIRTNEADRNLKLATKKLMKASKQKDSQKRKINQTQKYKRNDANDSNSQKKYYEWLILPDQSINSFNKFQNDSMTDTYRRKFIISSYRQPRVTMNENKVLGNGESNGIRSEISKRQNFENDQNSNLNEQVMRKSWIPNVVNVAGQNSANFGYRIADTRGGKHFQKFGRRNSNLKSNQNVNTNIQYGTYYQNGNLGTVGANVISSGNPTTQNFVGYQSSSNNQYPTLTQQNNYADSAAPPTSGYFGTNASAGYWGPGESDDYWDTENDGIAKSFLQSPIIFPTISFTPGQPNQYPGLREIYVKNFNSSLPLFPKKERREITLTNDSYYFDGEYFQKLPTGQIVHQRRVVVENSIVPTKLYGIDDVENLYKGVQFLLDHRVKREDYYRLPFAENKKNSTTGSKEKFKNQSNVRSGKKKIRKISKINKAKSPERKISNKKNSIKSRDVDEFYLNLKDHGHDYIAEEEQIAKAEDEEYSDVISHEDHTSSLIIKEKPKTRKIIIFKRDTNVNVLPNEDPSTLNLAVSDINENFQKSYSKKKRLPFRMTKKRKHKYGKKLKKESKIDLNKKPARKDDPKSKKNDFSKFISEDMKKVYSKTMTNVPEQNHQAADLKYDGIKEQYLMTDTMMTDGLSNDDLNKNILIPIKFRGNERMADFIASKNTPMTSVRPMIIENKRWDIDQLKRNLMARDKVTDDDSASYTSIESHINRTLNSNDTKLKESNHQSKLMAPVDDLPLEVSGARKSWDQLDIPDSLTECNIESVSMIPPDSRGLQQTADNDPINSLRTNSLAYKPYVPNARSRSFFSNIIDKIKNTTNLRTYVNTSNINWNTYSRLDPEKVNFEVQGKQACGRGLDACSEEDSEEDKIEDDRKDWPISPGPIVCNPDYNIPTTFAARSAEFPYVVSIQYKNLETQELSHICNGIIIGSRYILSAAHCLNNRDNLELVVQRAYDLCNDDTKTVPVALIMEHENYNNHTRMNDLALLKLKHEVDVDQVSMPDNDVMTNDFFSVGWGELMWNRFKENVTKIQQKIPLARYPDRIKEDPGTIYVTTAGLDITGTFRGDYGGILVNKQNEFVGLQSKIHPVEDYEVFIRIRTYLPWIENMMKFSKRLLDHPFKFRTRKPKGNVDK